MSCAGRRPNTPAYAGTEAAEVEDMPWENSRGSRAGLKLCEDAQ